MRNSTISSSNDRHLNELFHPLFYTGFLKKKLDNFINTSSAQESSSNFNKNVVCFSNLIVLRLQDSVLRVTGRHLSDATV